MRSIVEADSVGAEEYRHVPVLRGPLLAALDLKGHETVLDCTVATGGHATLLLSQVGRHGRLIGLDSDSTQLERARAELDRFGDRASLHRRNFAEFDGVLAELGIKAVDVIFADLGVSSIQLDDPRRGFAFQHDGPLDMRIDTQSPTTAADLVNSLPENELADLLYNLAQENSSRRIARQICKARHNRRIRTTGELADIVARAVGAADEWHREKIHPATRTFLALRMAVNHELESLESLLTKAPQYLTAGGKIAIITFHSVEDRLVKQSFLAGRRSGLYRLTVPKPITADEQERRENPRSRSAKLRVAERTNQQDTPSTDQDGRRVQPGGQRS